METVQNWFEPVQNWFELVQRLLDHSICGFSAVLDQKWPLQTVPGGTLATFTGAGRELSEVILSLDQYLIIILMLYHQFPGSNSCLIDSEGNEPHKKIDCEGVMIQSSRIFQSAG
jgi:hypothetical protein